MTLTSEIFTVISEQEEHAKRVRVAVQRERVKRDALRQLEAEEQGPLVLPAGETLQARLARPVIATRYRIEEFQPRDSRIILVAQFKAGKTTLIANLVRCLVDGDTFLGRYAVDPVPGVTAILDFEMGNAQLDAWYRAQHIRDDARVVLESMKGRAGTFNPIDPATRRLWVAWFRARRTKYLVLDCLRPILDALGLDEHHDCGRFLVAFDALLAEAEIPEAAIVHHMGHMGERARGDSRLRDWPDVELRLVRQDENPASARYLTAYGRDVDVPEIELLFDALTRRLTMRTGSRQDAKVKAALEAVVTALDTQPAPLSGRKVWKELEDSGHARDDVYGALALGVKTGALQMRNGSTNSKQYSSVRSVREVSAGHSDQCPAAYMQPDTRTLPGTRDYEPHRRDTQHPDLAGQDGDDERF